jgi:anaerobic selenocysteine-containing dehydrogenase
MTNHWNDLANSDCVMIVGCNPAENHPISFKYITQVQEKGGKLIVVDPASPARRPRPTCLCGSGRGLISSCSAAS